MNWKVNPSFLREHGCASIYFADLLTLPLVRELVGEILWQSALREFRKISRSLKTSKCENGPHWCQGKQADVTGEQVG